MNPSLKQHWKEGVICPCCDQRVQLYKRQIYRAMANEFTRLARLCADDYPLYDNFYHIDEYRLTHGGDMVKMRYWGLIEEQPENFNEKTRTSGHWRLTDDGWAYLRGELAVPKYAWIYNQRVVELSGPNVTIRDALGTDFDYREVIND